MNSLKKIYHFIRVYLLNKYYDIKWNLSKNKREKKCMNEIEHNQKIIVSLTSFPGRINLVNKTIKSILNQKKVKPDELELWLAREQFKELENSLPKNIIELKKYGLKIYWCDDLKSYKKLIPSLEKHPNDIIVTADDDVYYSRTWLEKLYSSYKKDSKSIHCHRVTKFYIEEGNYKTKPGGYFYYDYPSYLNKLVGIGGVLYPPNSLSKDVFRKDIFMQLAPTNDDIWFWFMAIINHTKISVVEKNIPMPIDIIQSLKTDRLTSINDNGKKLFWVQFNNLINYYPGIDNILKNELKNRKVNL